MMGVAETISGVFCMAVGSVAGQGVGLTLIGDGCIRMSHTLLELWAQHEIAMLEFKKWETSARSLENSN